MTKMSDRLPDIAKYIALIDAFIGGEMAANEFDLAYLKARKSEQRVLGDTVFPILQQLFGDADAYVSDPSLRTEPEDLDDEQLRECARRARKALRDLGYQ